MPIIKRSSKPMDVQPSPDERSLSTAYNTQKATRKKKFALGGEATNEPAVPMAKPDNKRFSMDEYMSDRWSEGSAPPRKPDNERLPEDEYMADHFAEGGEVDEHYDSIADAILRKRKGGKSERADIESNAEETPASLSPYDDDNTDAVMDPLYDDDQLMDQPLDSNEHDHEIDSDDNSASMIDKIRKKMKKGA